jgi:integrase
MIDAFNDVDGLKAGLAVGGVTTHGLRYTAATRLYELGCSFAQIAAITGHETIAMVKKYIEKKRDAQFAIATLNAATDAQRSNESDNPDPEK